MAAAQRDCPEVAEMMNSTTLQITTQAVGDETLLEMGDRTDKVSTLRLKAARTPVDTEPAKPPRRGRPVAQAPPVRAPPQKQRGRPRQVTCLHYISPQFILFRSVSYY